MIGRQLAPHEISALREEELDDPFFTALARVQQIHANCKVLLRTHHQVREHDTCHLLHPPHVPPTHTLNTIPRATSFPHPFLILANLYVVFTLFACCVCSEQGWS